MEKYVHANDSSNDQELPLTPNPGVSVSHSFFQSLSSPLTSASSSSPLTAGFPYGARRLANNSLPPLVPYGPRLLPISDAVEPTDSALPSSNTLPQQVLINVVEEEGSGSELSPTSTPEKAKLNYSASTATDTPPSSHERLDFNDISLSPATSSTEIVPSAALNKQAIELAPLPTRQRARRDQVSKPLATFLEQMAIPVHAFDASERAMLDVILSPKTWKQKLPAYLSLPAASEVITKVLFYLSINKKDLGLASPQALPGLTETELNKALRLQNHAMPLFNQKAITRAYRIAGFSNKVSLVGNVWLLLYLSLQINAIALNVYNLSDIFLDPYNIVKFVTDSSQSTKASLANSLSGYVVWPFLIGIPLIAGSFSSWRYGKMAQSMSEASKQADLELLKNYTPSTASDYLRWYLPNHPLSGALTRLRLNLLYNGNESTAYRDQAFEVLMQFLAKARGHTQLSARAIMASLAFDISLQDLIKAKAIFPRADYTQTIKMIGKANFNLMGAAFLLSPQEHENPLDAFLRAGITRYLTYRQQLGHAGNLLLLFILYDFYVSYGDTSLTLIVLKGIINGIKNIEEMVKCKQDNKVWVWRKESKIYVCSACGDVLELAYQDIWTQESCVTAFLDRLQPAEKIVDFFNQHNLQDITSLDFSTQISAAGTPYHNASDLDAIFSAINKRVPLLSNFSFTANLDNIFLDVTPDSSYAGAPLGRFLANAKQLRSADFSYLCLQANGTVALASYLNQTTLTSLNYTGNLIADIGLAAITQALPQTQLKALNVKYSENSDETVQPFVDACLATPSLVDITYGASYTTDASAQWLSQLLLKPNLINFAVYSYLYTDVAIMFYAAQLAQAKNLTAFSIEYYSMLNETTIRALTDSLAQIPVQQLMIQGYSGDPTVPGLDYFFYRLKDTLINILTIGGSACIDEASSAAFATYFPQSQVQLFQVGYCYNPALSANATNQFANGLYRSNISFLLLNSMSLSNGFSGNFQQVLLAPKLETVVLTLNDIDESLNLALIDQLPASNLRTLRIFTGNGITDTVVNRTADILSQTQLNTIRFGDESITRFSIQRLFDKAIQPGSNIQSFEIYESQLGDDGASYIASRLPGTSLTTLLLGTSQIGDVGAINIAQALTRHMRSNLLWLDLVTQADPNTIEPTTQLTLLNLGSNNLSPIGARAVFDNLHYTNIPSSHTILAGNNLTLDDLSEISLTSSASRQATIPWPIQLSYMLLVTLPQQVLNSSPQLIGHKEDNNESLTDSCKDVVFSILIMFLAYKLIFSPLKEKLQRTTGFGFFDTKTNNTSSLNDEYCTARYAK